MADLEIAMQHTYAVEGHDGWSAEKKKRS